MSILTWENVLSVTIHINCSIARCLINLVYLTACAFIRSWWCCTLWMTSPMTLNRHKNLIISSYSLVWRVNQLGKLINRIPGLRLLISSLPGSASWMHVESLCKHRWTSILEALPGILDIKRNSPSILYFSHTGYIHLRFYPEIEILILPMSS